MSESQVDIARTLGAALASRDVETFVSLVDYKVQFFAPKTGAETGQPYHLYLGHEGIHQYFQQVASVWDVLEFEPREFRERDEYVIALGSITSRPRGGRDHEEAAAWGWRFRAGKAEWARAYLNPIEALREIPMPKIDLVASAIVALSERDLEAMKPFISPVIEFEAPVTSAATGDAKVYRGHDGMAECFVDMDEVWERIDVDVSHYLDVADHVVGFGHLRGQTKDGRDVDTPTQWVWRFEAEQIAWIRAYTNADAALRAVGLAAE